MNYADRFHFSITQNRWAKIFTLSVRGLLGIGFILPGLIKLFSPIPFGGLISKETAIGAFFEAFFSAEGLYILVGLVQVLAGTMLFFSSTMLFGAVIYFPLIVAISVITWTFDFQGTWIIASLMTLANFYLLCWEYDRLKVLLPLTSSPVHFLRDKNGGPWDVLVFGGCAGLIGLSMFMLITSIHGNNSLLLPITFLVASVISTWGVIFPLNEILKTSV